MLTFGGKKRKTRRGTKKGMRRKSASRAGLRLAYDGGKKSRKSTRKGMRRKTARRAYMKGGYYDECTIALKGMKNGTPAHYCIAGAYGSDCPETMTRPTN